LRAHCPQRRRSSKNETNRERQPAKTQLSAPLTEARLHHSAPICSPPSCPQLHNVARKSRSIEETSPVLPGQAAQWHLTRSLSRCLQPRPTATKPLDDEPFSLLIHLIIPFIFFFSFFFFFFSFFADATMFTRELDDNKLLLLAERPLLHRGPVLECLPSADAESAGRSANQLSNPVTKKNHTAPWLLRHRMTVSSLPPMTALQFELLSPTVQDARPYRPLSSPGRASFPRPKAIEILTISIRLAQ